MDTQKIPHIIYLLLLCLFTFTFYIPYFFNIALGGSDAEWYHALLSDLLLQYHHGIFPIYVGQSDFNFIGAPAATAPYLAFLSGLIDYLSLNKLSVLQVQHTTVIVSALFGAWSMYIVLNLLNANLRWLAFMLALFYITCPGIMGLINYFDAYRAFIAIPFFPILIYGLIRTYQSPTIHTSILIGAALAAIHLAHPPLGIWAGILSTIFYFLLLITRITDEAITCHASRLLAGIQPTYKTGCQLKACWHDILQCIIVTLLTFLILDAWQLVFVLQNNLNAHYLPQFTNYSEIVMTLLKKIIPGVLLPLNWSNEQMAPLQLGYSLWFLLLISIYIYFFEKNKMLKNFLVGIFLLFIFVFPIPFLTRFIYSLMPMMLQEITSQWPMFRIYFLLSVLIIFLGYCSFANIHQNEQWKNFCRITLLILAMLFLWNIHETKKMIDFSLDTLSIQKTLLWSLSENTRFVPAYEGTHSHLPEGTYDAALENKVLDNHLQSIPSLNNHDAIIQQCSHHLQGLSLFGNIDHAHMIPLAQFGIKSQIHYAICINLLSQYSPGIFHLSSQTHHTVLYHLLGIDKERQNKLTAKTLILPVYCEKNCDPISLSFFADPQNPTKAFIHFKSYAVTQYDHAKLPIKITSLIPYMAEVNVKKNIAYLQTHRFYLHGYKAWVNQKEVPVLRSPENTVMIPLTAGKNIVMLNFTGTPLMQFSFYLSCSGWMLVLLYLLFFQWRRYLNQ